MVVTTFHCKIFSLQNKKNTDDQDVNTIKVKQQKFSISGLKKDLIPVICKNSTRGVREDTSKTISIAEREKPSRLL